MTKTKSCLYVQKSDLLHSVYLFIDVTFMYVRQQKTAVQGQLKMLGLLAALLGNRTAPRTSCVIHFLGRFVIFSHHSVVYTKKCRNIVHN